AMGGVVVIRNRWRAEEGYELQNDLAYGSYQTLRESLSFLGRLGRWDLAAGAHLLDTEGHRDGADGRLQVGHLAARFRVSSNLSLSMRSKVIHLEAADPGTVTHPLADHWFDVWRNQSSLGMDYERKWLRLSVKSYLNAGVHRLYDGFFSQDFVGGGTVESTMLLHRTLELVLGAAAEHQNGHVENRGTGEVSSIRGLTSLSFYNQLRWRPLPALTLVGGTRELYSTTYGFALLYKAGVRWQICRGLFTSTRVAKNFRQPTIRELYLPYPTANPELKPEVSLNWDFTFGFSSRRLEISGTLYRTHARNLIKYFGAWPSSEVVNIDEIEVWGVSGKLALHRLGPMFVTMTAAWQDVGRYTRQSPEAKLNFELGFSHSFGRHLVSGALSGEWVHGLFMSNYGRDPIDDVFFMDMTLRYRYRSGSRRLVIEPYLHLRNFLDRSYAYIQGYAMPGIHALVGLKLGL
ncbi:MAG: TonB-dependent receptor, partial [Polyangia bacterium]|nr:TonB-dependent receptor [Polyangia bacterium]